MYLLFRRGVVNGGQWGPVNDEQAAIVSDNLGRLCVAVAKKMVPDAEVETAEEEDAFTFATTACKVKPEPDDAESAEVRRVLHEVTDAISVRLNDPALWRKDFDAAAYLEANPL